MIYVIGVEGSPLVKIGLAADPAARLAGLQTGNPQPLKLLYSHEGGRELESHLHATFFDQRIRGEWFDLTPLGHPVAVVCAAIAEARQQELLVAPQFRTPSPVPAPRTPQSIQVVTQPVDPERPAFPLDPPSVSTTLAKPGCIRVWDRTCHRSAGTTCNC